jgi:hypothetical protein
LERSSGSGSHGSGSGVGVDTKYNSGVDAVYSTVALEAATHQLPPPAPADAAQQNPGDGRTTYSAFDRQRCDLGPGAGASSAASVSPIDAPSSGNARSSGLEYAGEYVIEQPAATVSPSASTPAARIDTGTGSSDSTYRTAEEVEAALKLGSVAAGGSYGTPRSSGDDHDNAPIEQVPQPTSHAVLFCFCLFLLWLVWLVLSCLVVGVVC